MFTKIYNLQKRYLVFFICLLILGSFILNPGYAFASGTGVGGGAGPGDPLYMDKTYPAKGATNVSLNPLIQIKYSKNVAHYVVLAENIKKITLTTSGGSSVKCRIYGADTQLEFDKRQYIYVEPVSALKPNTTYKVTAAAGIQARNNMITEKAESFSFTTGSSRGSFNKSSVQSMVADNSNNTDNNSSSNKNNISDGNSGNTSDKSAGNTGNSNSKTSNTDGQNANQKDNLNQDAKDKTADNNSKNKDDDKDDSKKENKKNTNSVDLPHGETDNAQAKPTVSLWLVGLILLGLVLIATVSYILYLRYKNNLPLGAKNKEKLDQESKKKARED